VAGARSSGRCPASRLHHLRPRGLPLRSPALVSVRRGERWPALLGDGAHGGGGPHQPRVALLDERPRPRLRSGAGVRAALEHRHHYAADYAFRLPARRRGAPLPPAEKAFAITPDVRAAAPRARRRHRAGRDPRRPRPPSSRAKRRPPPGRAPPHPARGSGGPPSFETELSVPDLLPGGSLATPPPQPAAVPAGRYGRARGAARRRRPSPPNALRGRSRGPPGGAIAAVPTRARRGPFDAELEVTNLGVAPLTALPSRSVVSVPAAIH
jgi:hypothetical protein